jgi:hypothetical protein
MLGQNIKPFLLSFEFQQTKQESGLRTDKRRQYYGFSSYSHTGFVSSRLTASGSLEFSV